MWIHLVPPKNSSDGKFMLCIFSYNLKNYFKDVYCGFLLIISIVISWKNSWIVPEILVIIEKFAFSRERERERRRSRERSPQRKRSRERSPRRERERSPRRVRRVVPRYTVQFSKFSLDWWVNFFLSCFIELLVL